ncbi:MAG TPA: CpsB/CapC family capsule biosynthesis tyrosine phosphatase [Tepidisphaeraceae bacterium]|nr:CpsB/CapC family capsule biosynthesis tyrosine phosphatase [Tepidisphaeraceae bacterium]
MSSTHGRIDVHSHLLPGVDDGCATLEESLACARKLAEAGYTHAFCTPHIWPNLPKNTVEEIGKRTARLQHAFDEAKVPLKLLPGGELNLRPDIIDTPPDELPTYGMARKFCLFDIWAEKIPGFFWKSVEWLKSLGLRPIIAHPERMRAVQDQPELAQEFADAGLLLQGNLQCFGDPPHTHTRRLAEQFLQENRYFALGSDCHNLPGLQLRLDGLKNAIGLVGREEILRLTRDNPAQLIA